MLNTHRNDAMMAYAESVGGFAKCLKNKDEDFYKMFELETLRFPSEFHCTNRTKIKNVIFNDPATIVFWTDGTKTVVKAQDGDIFDPEKGLALAISKKALGNKGNYCNELKKWLPKEETEVQEFNYIGNVESITNSEDAVKKLKEGLKKLTIPKLNISQDFSED